VTRILIADDHDIVRIGLRAIAIAAAIVMILELEKGLGALVHISPQPMRQAVRSLEAEQAVTKFGNNGSWAPGP
jgi:DNA-binding NarL/FixJ family response regulator